MPKENLARWVVLKYEFCVLVLLGEPRPNQYEQSRILQEARNWLYALHGSNVVQQALETNGQVWGWQLTPNGKAANRKVMQKWLNNLNQA